MFVEKGSPDPIHEAIDQVIAALFYCWDMELEMFEQLAHKKFSLLYPVIVLDGQLFSAHVEPSGNIELKESNHLQLKVLKALKEPLILDGIENSRVLSYKPIIIDIVCKEYFEKYLEYYR
jgi:hypothetical protein